VFHADEREILKMPLVNQPNTVWEYGIGIDWAGICLERATGVRLNDWIQDNIMKPLDLKNINMIPTPEMKKSLAYMHQKCVQLVGERVLSSRDRCRHIIRCSETPSRQHKV
jgi:CubicO group peptidase (beta-lactamase class C family)